MFHLKSESGLVCTWWEDGVFVLSCSVDQEEIVVAFAFDADCLFERVLNGRIVRVHKLTLYELNGQRRFTWQQQTQRNFYVSCHYTTPHPNAVTKHKLYACQSMQIMIGPREFNCVADVSYRQSGCVNSPTDLKPIRAIFRCLTLPDMTVHTVAASVKLS